MSRPVEDIPTEELGAEYDMTRDYLRRVRHALGFVQNTYADLDGMADGDLASAPTHHLRDAQEHLSEAAELLGSEKKRIETRLEAIEERIEEELGDD